MNTIMTMTTALTPTTRMVTPMTMVFRVADPKMLDPLNVGDRIRFAAERINGQYTLTAASKAP